MISLVRPGPFRTGLYFAGLYLLFRLAGAPPVAVALPEALMMPIEGWATAFLAGHSGWAAVLRFVLVAMTAFSLSRIVIRHSIYIEKTFLPALFYLVVAMGLGYTLRTPLAAGVAWLLVTALDGLVLSHRSAEQFGSFFQAAVALGAMPLLYAPTVVFVVLLPVGFVLFRQQWRGVVAALIGYLFPMALCCYVGWGMGGDFLAPAERLAAIVQTPAPAALATFGPGEWMLAVLMTGATLWSLVLYSLQYKLQRSRTKRGTTLLVWTAIAAAALVALPCRSVDMLPIVAVPVAALVPGGLIRGRNWVSNLLMIILLLATIGYNLRGYLAGTSL